MVLLIRLIGGILRIHNINLLNYFAVSIVVSISLSSALRISELRLTCVENGLFSITDDCGGFISCLQNEAALLKHCPAGHNFDATQQQCLLQEKVDCSKQYLSRPRFTDNRLRKKRTIVESHPASLVRHERATTTGQKSPTKPWGKFVNGVYIPYLMSLAENSLECVPIIDITEAPGEPLEVDEVLEPEDGPHNDPIHFADNAPAYKKQQITGDKMTFLSEDMDAGANKEAHLQALIKGTAVPKIWTQEVNTVLDDHTEPLETATE